MVPVAVFCCHFSGKTEWSGEHQPVNEQDGSNRGVEQRSLLFVSQQGIDAANDDHVQHDEDEQNAIVFKEIPAEIEHQAEDEDVCQRLHRALKAIGQHCLPLIGAPHIEP